MNRLLELLDFSKIRVLYTKENSNLSEWKNCCLLPFSLLSKYQTYNVTCVKGIGSNCYGLGFSGTVDDIFFRMPSHIERFDRMLYIISDAENQKNMWLVIRL